MSIVFLFVFIGVSGQTGKSYKYRFNGNLKQASVVSEERSIIINYSVSELDIESFENIHGSFYRISIPGHLPSPDTGKPELPVLSRLIAIPDSSSYRIIISDVRSAKIKPSEKDIKGLLFPAQTRETKQTEKHKTRFVMDRKLYSRRGLIESDTVLIEPLGKIRNKQVSNLVISPVRYNPSGKSLEVITSMKIEIIFSQDIARSAKSLSSESALFNGTFEKGILNYYPGDRITDYSDEPVEMIVITDTTFKKYLEPFYRWKLQKGFRLHVLYVGEGNTGTTYGEIKEAVNKIYSSSSNAGHAPEYLLIVGGVNKVPSYGTENLSDMYYGEFDGGGDFIPDTYIGRIPVNDTNSVKSFVRKLVQYEKFEFADTNNFYSRAMIITGKDASYGEYMNGQVKYAITNYLKPENKIDNYHFYYPEGYTKRDSIMKLITDGVSFINYTGHGSSTAWLHLDIKGSDVSKFNNSNMYPFVVSNACRTAQYNDTTSLGVKMINSSQEEGAIGFIGCSNDSYWDEDFYYSVGTCVPGSDPTYSGSGPGFYDRLFHTHGEPASEWYITMGQVNYAGNLAVSSSSTLASKKKYYWETYSLLGDPSVIPVLGKPGLFDTVVPDTIPNGTKSLTLVTDPHAYVAVSHFDYLWDASFAGPSGSVELTIPGLSNDSCLIVITGQNKVSLIKTVYFSDIKGEYINLSETKLNDSQGNSNGKADYGEKVFLDLKITNLGLTDATGLTVSISSTSEWVTILNNSYSLDTLKKLSEVTITAQFGLLISDNIPDQGIITIDILLKDSKTEKTFKKEITIHAPELELINCVIDDSVYGNHNFIADPGESFRLIFQVKNLGSSSTSGQLLLANPENHLTILDSEVKSGILTFGTVSDISVLVKLSETVGTGDYISISSTLDCNPYIVKKDFSFRVGRIRESFESNSFKVFPWINISSVPWTISKSDSADGILAALSGRISHSSSSTLIIRTFFDQPDSLKFSYKVSSEPSYDYLAFRLNDNEIFRKSGDTGWERISVAVPAGLNKMEWIYKKDNSVSYGADRAWIDLIDFSKSGGVSYIGKDIEIAAVESPVQKDVYGLEPVIVKVKNNSCDTLTGFNLAYSVNNLPPVKQYFKTILLPYQDSVTVTFDRRADLDLRGIYEVKIYGCDNEDDYVFNDTLSVSINNTDYEESLNIFPNPFTDKLTLVITSNSEKKIRISLIDNSGKRLQVVETVLSEGDNQLTIDTSNLSPSIYLLNIIGTNITKVFPLIKVKK